MMPQILEKNPHLQMYVDEMVKLKKRLIVVVDFLNKISSTRYHATNIESMYLQIRKVLELIMLSSLIVCKKEYTEVYNKLQKEWSATNILKAIKAKNKNFYPKPAKPLMNNGNIISVEILTDINYLTEDEFSKLYGKCGAMLHIQPLSKNEPDYMGEEENIKKILTKINNLLRVHMIDIKDDVFYVIHMSGNNNDDVIGYPCTKMNYPLAYYN